MAIPTWESSFRYRELHDLVVIKGLSLIHGVMASKGLNKIITKIHRTVLHEHPNVSQNEFDFILERNVWRYCFVEFDKSAKFAKENPKFLYPGFGPTQELRDEHHAACAAATATILPAATAPNESLPRASTPQANEASPKASNVELPVPHRSSADLDENAAANNNAPGAVPTASPVNSTQAIAPMAYSLPKGMVIDDFDRPLEWTQDSVINRMVIEAGFVDGKDFRGQPQFGWQPTGYPRFSMITYAIYAGRAMKGGSDYTLWSIVKLQSKPGWEDFRIRCHDFLTHAVIWLEWRNLANSTDPVHFQKWLKVYAFLQWWAIPCQRAGEACQNLVVAWAQWQKIPEESRPRFSLAENAMPKLFFNFVKKKFPHLDNPHLRKTGHRGKGGKNGKASAPAPASDPSGSRKLESRKIIQ